MAQIQFFLVFVILLFYFGAILKIKILQRVYCGYGMVKTSKILAFCLVALWLVLVAWAFWWFQLRFYSSMDQYLKDELFSADSLQLAYQPHGSDITIYHFFDSSCPCSRFNTEHVQEVMLNYEHRAVKFVVVVPHESALTEAKSAFPNADFQVSPARSKPPASPAALIYSKDAQAEYIGPWSPGAVCNSRSDDYVTQVVDELLLNKTINQTQYLARGCLCPWPVGA